MDSNIKEANTKGDTKKKKDQMCMNIILGGKDRARPTKGRRPIYMIRKHTWRGGYHTGTLRRQKVVQFDDGQKAEKRIRGE
ncbi:hypothetical protein HanHA300_Chr02g0053551 [Helianthus annuus]|nr:hypothetical protein HanHA300_Chr02g0053551 [Helianthus annuus]